MSEFSINRRDLLQMTGAGVLGTAGFSQVGAVKASSAGDKVWEFEANDVIRGSPTVVGETVFAGSDDENLYAINATNGTERWSYSTSSSIMAQIRAAPSVVDDTVYFGTNMRGFGRFYALNATDGSKEWRYKTGSRVLSSPTVVDGTVYVGNNGGTPRDPSPNLYALDADDGSRIWQFQTGGSIQSSPTVVDGTVYVGSDDSSVYAVNATDGTEQWSTSLSQYMSVRSSPTVVDETVYVGLAEPDGNSLYALDAETGSVQWKVDKGGIDSSPTVIDGTLYIGSFLPGRIHAVDIDDGSSQWTFETNGRRVSSPTVAGDVVYIGSTDGVLYALDKDDGTNLWTYDTGTSFLSSPIVSDGTLYVGCGIIRCCAPGDGEGTLYAIDVGSETPSNGSRVNLGTLNHNNTFAEKGPTGPGIPDDPDLVASFSFSPKTPNIGDSVTFDASSSNPADAIQEYRWDFTGDGEVDATGVTVDKIFEDAEDQTVRLTVVDNSGNETSTEKSLTVDPLPQISISLTPQEIDFGVQSIASTPQRTLTLENTTDQAFTVDADTPASVRFSPDDDLFDIDLPFVGVEPPFSLDPGESQTAILGLDTSEAVQNSSMDGDVHLRQSISLSTESGEIAEVPIRVTIFNGEAVAALRNAAKANSDLFDAEQIQEEGAYENLSNMYKNLFEIVKELGTGPNYLKAIKPLVDFASSLPQAAENQNIGEAIRKARFDETQFDFSPEEFEDGYDEVSKDFDKVINEIENGNNSEVSNNYDDAEKRLKNLTDKWDESKGEFINILGNTLTGEDAFEKAEDLAIEYTNAIDGLFKLVQGTTPLYLTTASPVNITAIDPDGQKIGPNENEIPGSIYKEIDRGKDGTTEDLIYIQDKKPGEYRVNVSKSDDGSGDSFSLVAVTDDDSMVIADETPVSDIPDDGYKIETSEAPESDPTAARPGDYATEDGLVTVNGLREAIADWRNTDITDELLSQVTTVWIEQKEVD